VLRSFPDPRSRSGGGGERDVEAEALESADTPIRIRHPHPPSVIRIRHLSSAIRHPPSVIRHPPSVIRHPPSVIRLGLGDGLGDPPRDDSRLSDPLDASDSAILHVTFRDCPTHSTRATQRIST
jgi:hypothetical protein